MKITNTLIEYIKKTKFAGEAFQNINKLKDQKVDITNFSALIDEIHLRFSTTYSNYSNLKAVVNITIDFTAISSNLFQLKEKFGRDEYDRISANTIKREIVKIDTELKRVWDSYIANRTTAIDSILTSLDKLISDMPEKQTLTSKKMLFSSTSPGSPTAINAIEVYVNTANALLSKLNLKDSVVEFIKLLTLQKTVTLNDLNDEIYEWIKINGFADKIKLEFKK